MRNKKKFSVPVKLTDNALTVLKKRYLRTENGKVVETPEEMLWRVARNIAEAEKVYHPKISLRQMEEVAEKFYEMMAKLEFLPNSPTLMNAGRELQQLAACFVLPIEDSLESIFETIKNAALIHKSGGGTGFSFSRLRPKSDKVLSTGGVASGPVSFIKVFNAATEAVKQGGTRRGANMGILQVDHPDILEFITSKQDPQNLTNFNISVATTDAFLEGVKKDEDYSLINPRTGSVVKKLPAPMVFDLIVESAWKTGEPGIVFIDRINQNNPLPKLGKIESTNPCGEQPLLPYESCVLGSINLSKMVKYENGKAEIDFDHLQEIIFQAVRFLDNVIDMNRYPLAMIETISKSNRKIGLGVMGFADLLILLGIPYDTLEALQIAEKVMSFIQKEGYHASEKLAEERGPFLNFKDSVYHSKGSPQLRNATVTTIAPTGTLSIIAGCSSGIEPIFAVSYVRQVLENTRLIEVHPIFEEIARKEEFYSPQLIETVAQKGSIQKLEEIPESVRRLFVTAHDIAPEWHVRMQAAFQKYTDNAVSKTVNLRPEVSKEDVRKVFMLAYEEGCKGVTIYRHGSRENQVLSIPRRGKIEPRRRPAVISGRTEKIRTGCGNLYITINEDKEGLCEVFSHLGKSGGCASAQLEAISRLISLALRAGVKTESIIKHLRGIRCHSPSWQDGGPVLSCPDALGISLERYVQWKNSQKSLPKSGEEATISGEVTPPQELNKNIYRESHENPIGACPECGGVIEHEGGCAVCRVCGYTRCI